uniref:SUN domain-containing protein n=1 Tax=Glossina brevipalpis TaxID=37001 RepID=A0A1A9WJN2_9MUSC
MDIRYNIMRSCVLKYLFGVAVIFFFASWLISMNRHHSKMLERLRDDIDKMAHVMLLKSGNPKCLKEMIDKGVEKHLPTIYDELYAIKKSLKEREYPGLASSKSILKIEGRVNYASEDLGAKIVSVEAEPLYSPNFIETLMGTEFVANPPGRILESKMEPGNCFAFRHGTAIVTINLPQLILIDQIGVQHISKKQSPNANIASAPKDFTVFAKAGNQDVLLGKFRYEWNQNKLLQTFGVQSTEKYNMLRFHFKSNHGHPDYTCVYRIIVYGKIY